MATKQLTVMIDDLTGKELADGAGETVRFAIDGNNYELDVDSKGAEKLRSSLAPYLSAGRRVAGSQRQPVRRVSTAPDPRAVRAWAAANGIEVSDRGRIPGSVVEQFHAAGH